jgi:hypothetical protein
VGEGSGSCRVLVGKPEGKRPPGRPRRKWVDININLNSVWSVLIGLFWLRIGTRVDTCESDIEYWGSIKCREFLDQLRNC